MKLFVLLMTIHYADGDTDVYVIDHALSGADCIQSVLDHAHREVGGVVFSCEIDNAMEAGS